MDKERESSIADQSLLGAVLAERGPKYGPFSENAVIAQDIKDIMRSAPNWKHLALVHKEALDLIVLKISRILSTGADPTYQDNWVDIAGYATLAAKKWEK